jgi:hypothetical protein
MWSDSASAILSHAGPIQCGQLTANRILVSGTAGLIGNAAAMTNGQLLIGSTGVAPVVANLTAGAGISITNGAGTISISNSTGTAGEATTAFLATTQQNNFAVTAVVLHRFSAAGAGGSVTITGFTGGVAGRVLYIFNVGSSNDIILSFENASSTAANRFFTTSGSDITLSPQAAGSGKGAMLVYDATSSRWRVTFLST